MDVVMSAVSDKLDELKEGKEGHHAALSRGEALSPKHDKALNPEESATSTVGILSPSNPSNPQTLKPSNPPTPHTFKLLKPSNPESLKSLKPSTRREREEACKCRREAQTSNAGPSTGTFTFQWEK